MLRPGTGTSGEGRKLATRPGPQQRAATERPPPAAAEVAAGPGLDRPREEPGSRPQGWRDLGRHLDPAPGMQHPEKEVQPGLGCSAPGLQPPGEEPGVQGALSYEKEGGPGLLQSDCGNRTLGPLVGLLLAPQAWLPSAFSSLSLLATPKLDYNRPPPRPNLLALFLVVWTICQNKC